MECIMHAACYTRLILLLSVQLSRKRGQISRITACYYMRHRMHVAKARAVCAAPHVHPPSGPCCACTLSLPAAEAVGDEYTLELIAME